MVFLARKGLCIKFTPFYSFLNKNQLIASPLLPAKWRLSFYLAYSDLFFVEIMIFLAVSISFEKVNFAKRHQTSRNLSLFGTGKCCRQTRAFLLNQCNHYSVFAVKKHIFKFCLSLLNLCYLQCRASILG